MLYAFALENLLKALMVAHGEQPTAEEANKQGKKVRRLAKRFRDHRLVVLWDLARLPKPTPMMMTLLEFLTVFGVTGRYPIRVQPETKWSRLTGDLKGAIVDLLTEVDNGIRTTVRAKGRREYADSPRFSSRGLRAPRSATERQTIRSPFRKD